MSCSECEGPVFARGLCQKHYTRHRRHGRMERVNMVQSGPCSFAGCDRAAHSRGLCWKHYQQARGYLRSSWANLRARYPGQYPRPWDNYEAFRDELTAALGERPSTKHQLRRPDPTRPWGTDNMVWREPMGVGSKTAEEAARYAWLWHLRKRYGLSEEALQAIVDAQGGACPICAKPLRAFTEKGSATKICVDHDHTAQGDPRAAVRGVLHDSCNKALGQLDDDPASCRRAAAYLEAHAAKPNPTA